MSQDETPRDEETTPPPAAETPEREATIEPADAELAGRLSEAYRTVKGEIAKVIIGQDAVVDLLLVSLFSRGHSVSSRLSS